MTEAEIANITSRSNAAIIAPAGHGKTEMVAELTAALPGRALVLTHTNAGVNALRSRLRKHNVASKKYALSTISAFCMRWTNAYPITSGIDMNLDYVSKRYFPDREKCTKRLFENKWAQEILTNSYQCVIVDEYQDCTQNQHEIFLQLNSELPVYVMGDPLQSIFGWAGDLVSWSELGFECVDVETYPWRWEKTNKDLGRYLTDIRQVFEPALKGKTVQFKTLSHGDYVQRIDPAEVITKAHLALNNFRDVLYVTQWQRQQDEFCRLMSGRFQNDEPQNLRELYDFAKAIDISDNYQKATIILDIAGKCATRAKSELQSYAKHIEKGNCDFSRIKRHPEFGKRLQRVVERGSKRDIISTLEYLGTASNSFHIFRYELYTEMIRSLQLAEREGILVLEAALQLRMNPWTQRSTYAFKGLASRTVLTKGLEFDCVIIDLTESLSATDVYVAMTRKKKIYIVTNKKTVDLRPPKGL